MTNPKKEDRDFLNASLIAKLPIELVFSIIAFLILSFSIYINFKLEYQAQPKTIDEVIPNLFPIFVIFLISIPFIVMPICTILALATTRTDIDVWQSFELTARLQFSLVRQVGSNFGAQGSLAKLNNIRRLSSFVWVKRSGETSINVRQDLRADINSLVDEKSLNDIADDISQITDKTYTGYTIKTINDKFIFDHYKRFRVVALV